MAAPQISMLPPAPSRADDGPSFSAKADSFVAALPTFRSEANAQADFTDIRATTAESAAASAQTNATATAADRVATAADRIQTGLDRVATAADRVQTGADRAQTTADKNAVNAALALASDKTVSYAGTHADARTLVPGLENGALIYIVNDERYTPPRRTLNRVSRDPNGALTADFLAGTYQADDIVAFLNFDTPQLVDVPANSAAPGFNGAFAVNATHFYFYANTQWLRIAGSTF